MESTKRVPAGSETMTYTAHNTTDYGLLATIIHPEEGGGGGNGTKNKNYRYAAVEHGRKITARHKSRYKQIQVNTHTYLLCTYQVNVCVYFTRNYRRSAHKETKRVGIYLCNALIYYGGTGTRNGQITEATNGNDVETRLAVAG